MNPAALRARRARNLRSLDRLELDQVATDVVVTYVSAILQDATRHRANASDAEDAYQRSLEILLTLEGPNDHLLGDSSFRDNVSASSESRQRRQWRNRAPVNPCRPS